MSDEKRQFTRVPFKSKWELTVSGVSYTAEEVKNLSVGGCLLPIKVDFMPGTECHVKIILPGTTSELNVEVYGEIVRCEPGAVAIKFVQISPGSLFHLKNIVLYNAADSGVVEKEIQEHPGLV